MQNGGFDYNNTMNFPPSHQQIHQFPVQNPPMYTTFDSEPQYHPQFHQPSCPPVVNPPLPSINFPQSHQQIDRNSYQNPPTYPSFDFNSPHHYQFQQPPPCPPVNPPPSMNFPQSHQQIDRFSFQNPLIYTSIDSEPRYHPQFYQPPCPPVNPRFPSGYCRYTDHEQRVRDESIYLHGLWHRGPSPNYIQNPNFSKPLHTTLFKKKNRKDRHYDKPYIASSDKEWPVDPKALCPPSPKQGWGEFKAVTSPKTFPVTSQEKDRVFALGIQLKGLDSCCGFFHKNGEDDDDDDDDDDIEEEEYDEEEAFDFFFNVFEEDEKLRDYYKSKCEGGEFYCLICGAIANKIGRKYKDCVALVQHSISISKKIKKRVAHRAYGRVVRKLLGWDSDRLPSLPSSNVNPCGIVDTQSLDVPTKREPPQGEVQSNIDGSDEKPTAVEKEEVLGPEISPAEPERTSVAV